MSSAGRAAPVVTRASPISLSSHNLQALLRELNDALILEGAAPAEWVACGGAALALRGFSIRTTRDVDVLGGWVSRGVEVVRIGEFPPEVQRALGRVAAAHTELRGMGPRWVNLGPQELIKHGLPDGFAARLTAVRAGDRLTLQLLGRIDLIALKLFAAADDMGPRQSVHLDDIAVLRPTAHEIAFAIEWIERMPDPDRRIRSSLKSIVEGLGHEDLAYYL